tara:strand:- start:1401 stop:1517 length:117 start_codon:yes stop_codon:yes gene_type:complete
MIEQVAQVFGMTFVGVIIVCLVITVGDYIIQDIKMKRK